MLKENCKFYNRLNHTCNALKETYCEKEEKECKFYITEYDYAVKEVKAQAYFKK